MSTKSLVALIVVLALLLVGLLVFTDRLGTQPETGTDTAGTPGDQAADMPDTSAGMRAENNAVVATDQKPDNQIAIAQVYLEAPGYVVIHEDNAGQPGVILGASALLSASQSDKVNVALSRPARDGEMLWAMLHAESNGNSTFESSIDTPVQSVLGGPIMGWFEIRADADENIEVTL